MLRTLIARMTYICAVFKSRTTALSTRVWFLGVDRAQYLEES